MESHERTMIVSKAECEFRLQISEKELIPKKFTLQEAVNIYAQCILDLSKEEIVPLNDIHKKLSELLEKISEKYNLTFGEKTRMLSDIINNHSKYIIRWERHRDLSKPGDWTK